MLNEPSSFFSQPSKAGETVWPLVYDNIWPLAVWQARTIVAAPISRRARADRIIAWVPGKKWAGKRRPWFLLLLLRRRLGRRRNDVAQRAADDHVRPVGAQTLAALGHLDLELVVGQRNRLAEV